MFPFCRKFLLPVLHIIGNYLELWIIIGASNVIKKSEESFRGREITTNYMKMERKFQRSRSLVELFEYYWEIERNLIDNN